MKKQTRFVLTLLAAFICIGPLWQGGLRAEVNPSTVRIGVLANRGRDLCLAHWTPTAQYLSEKVPGKTFEIVPLDFEEVYPAVKNGDVEFVLTNSSFYVELEYWFRVNRIATLKNSCTAGACTRFAGAIFVRADRDDLKKLSDLKGKSFMAVKETSLGGWRMAWRRLLENEIDPRQDFASLSFGGTHDAVVYAVLEGRVDAGTVRSDTLERMAAEGSISIDQFRVFPHASADDDEIPFLHSTEAYPEWPMAKVRHTDDELAQQVAVALLQMTPESPAARAATCAGWGIPLNYQSVHDCLKALKVGPYKDLGLITPLQALRAFWKWLLAAFLGFIALIASTLVIFKLNRHLALSNERFRAVMEGLDALVYVADMETYELLYINHYGRRTWGEVIGQLCWEVLQKGQTGPCTFCNNGRLLDSRGNPAGIEVWEFQNTVNQGWYECRDQAIRWTDGRFVRLEIATDITERKRTADELLHQNRFLNHVLESLTHPFMVINTHDYSVQIANAATGKSSEGCKCHQLTHRSDRPCGGADHPCPVDIIREKGRPVMVEHIHYNRDGALRNVEVYGYPIVDQNGRVSQIIEYSLDVTDRKRAEQELKEKEEYLRTIMATIQTGVLISEEESGRIVDVNPFAARMVGAPADSLAGQPWTRYLDETPANSETSTQGREGEDGQLKTVQGEVLDVRLSRAPACIRDQRYTIHGFLDISDIRQLMEKQAVNIELAKGLLSMVNPRVPKFTPIDDGVGLHIESLSLPCLAAGGDHFFVRRLPACGNGGGPATYLSVKDQSGHEVNCILRSIFTDLLHNAILQQDCSLTFERAIQQLNDRLVKGGMFAGEDFLTAMSARIDHRTLYMHYASCGHPPFLLIRDNGVVSFPQAGGLGQNLPLGTIEGVTVTSGRIRLRTGDRLLFYTDGLTEMPLEKHGWKISRHQLEEIVMKIMEKKQPCRLRDLMDALLETVAQLSDHQVQYPGTNTSADDVTLLGLEVEDAAVGHTRTLRPKTTEEVCDHIRELSDTITDQWETAGLGNAAQRVRVVLEEALLNAWKNGHLAKPGKPITVRWREGNDFHLDVIDEGDGFDPNLVSDPTLPKNRVKPSGRGIYMIRMFADEVQWRDAGRHLTTSFFRHPRKRDVLQPKPCHDGVPFWQLPAR